MNQPKQFEDDIQTESLTDLPLTIEQADETKGSGAHSAGGGGGAGKVSMRDFSIT